MPAPPQVRAGTCASLPLRRAAEAALPHDGGQGGRGGAWTEIEIRNDSSGPTAVAVRGAVKDIVEQLGVSKVLVSVAHCRTHATAYALALGREQVDVE